MRVNEGHIPFTHPDTRFLGTSVARFGFESVSQLLGDDPLVHPPSL